MKYLRTKGYIRKTAFVILAGVMIGIGVYGCKKEEPVSEDTTPMESVEPAREESLPEKQVSLEERLQYKIAFTSNRDRNDEIYIMNADGSGLKRLTNNRARDAGPLWFPDGKMIAFWSERDGMGKSEIYIMNADGSDQKRLTNIPAFGHYHDHSLSPDGEEKGKGVRYFFRFFISHSHSSAYNFSYVKAQADSFRRICLPRTKSSQRAVADFPHGK